MTTTRTAVEELLDGEQVPTWDPEAIGRSYDEAKANIAVDTGAWAQDEDDPWPETEKIDVHAITPPPASRPSSSPEPAPEPPAGPRRPWQAWRRWFSVAT
jgi:hypothetical protein